MITTISNGKLQISVDSFSAQLFSIKDAQQEYLWQRDPAYWGNCCPVLFPYVGRMENGTYYLDGQAYQILHHGFARQMEFALTAQSENRLEYTLTDCAETYEAYPRHFVFRVIYTLVENRLDVTYQVENKDEKTMYFGLGAHPGFRVPLEEGEKFEDFCLEFTVDKAKQMDFNEKSLISAVYDYPLPDKRLPLAHNLFDKDALLLTEAGHRVMLKKDDTTVLRVDFPQMDYIVFWHPPKTEAPFVCIQPWCSVPAWAGEVTVFEERKDLLTLQSGSVYENTWSVTVG